MAATPPVPTFAPGIVPTSLISAITTWMNFMAKPPAAVLRQTVVQSIPNNAVTPLAFDTTDLDSVSGHSNVTNNSRYVAQYAGWYMCGGVCGYAASAVNQRGLYWSVNGSLLPASGVLVQSNAGGITNIGSPPAQGVFLNVGDYLELQAFQNSGGALNTAVTSTNQPSASIWRMSS